MADECCLLGLCSHLRHYNQMGSPKQRVCVLECLQYEVRILITHNHFIYPPPPPFSIPFNTQLHRHWCWADCTAQPPPAAVDRSITGRKMLQERELGCDCCTEGEKGVVLEKGTCAIHILAVIPLSSLSDAETASRALFLWIVGGPSLAWLEALLHHRYF